IVLDAAPIISSEVVDAGAKVVVDAGLAPTSSDVGLNASATSKMAPGDSWRGRSKDKQKWIAVDPPATSKSPLIGSGIGLVPPEAPVKPLEFKSPIKPLDPKVVLTRTEIPLHSKLGTSSDTVRGESSGTALLPQRELLRCDSGTSRGTQSDVQPDSSDVESSDSELEEGEFIQTIDDKRYEGGLQKWLEATT
ncbi:hypothetical protein HID58_015683, partial [Brassica napus]